MALVGTENTLAPQLSTREKLILRCLIEGDSNKCIARKIDIAEATVKVHVKAILRKIRVQNRTQAAIWAMNNESLGQTANTDSPPLASSLGKRLQSAGVLIVDDVGVDTYSDERFFSYRRSVHRKQPDYGRHVHAVVLES